MLGSGALGLRALEAQGRRGNWEGEGEIGGGGVGYYDEELIAGGNGVMESVFSKPIEMLFESKGVM